MKELLNQLLPTLTTTFIAILVAIIGYIWKEVVKLVPIIIDNVVAKIGLTKYQQTRLIAMDIWNVVEEHFRLTQIVGDTIQAKVTMFETLIKQKIPGITDKDIELVRQAIAGEFNKDKPVVLKAVNDITTPIVNTVSVTPVTRYYAPDGTELAHVQATQTTDITAAPTEQAVQNDVQATAAIQPTPTPAQ